MSKTIIIAENGAAKTLTVDKLRTAGGGLFIPAEEALVDGITIRANGTYKASDFGLKAFDRVTVAVGSGGTALDGNARVGAIKAVTPVIREGNHPRSMGGTRYIKTRVPGGGACVWLPESAITTTTLTANRNGAYSPGDLYGYSQVTVNIGSGGGGWGGGDVSWGGGGDIPPWVESGEVDHIKITTPPAFLGAYLDGVPINFDGIEVTAFDENDNALGVIPFEELVFPVTVTDFDSVTGRTVQSDLDTGPIQKPFPLHRALHIAHCSRDGEGNRYVYGDYIYTSDAVMAHKTNNTAFRTVFAGENPGTKMGKWHRNNATGLIESTSVNANTSYTYNGQTVYYGAGTHGLPPIGYWLEGDFANDGSLVMDTIRSNVLDAIAWTMVYGKINEDGQAIPVQWTRPTDGEVLEDFFAISVDDLRPGGQGDDTPAYEEIPGILDIVF